MKKFFIVLFVLVFSYSNADALCFVEDVECLAPIILAGYESDPENEPGQTLREWSSSSGKMFAFDDWIVGQFRFDQESINILRSNSEFGLEIEAVISGPNRHHVQLRWTHSTFPSSAIAGTDTEVCDYVTNYGEDSKVFAIHLLNAGAIEKDTNYFVFFKLENNLPFGGVEIKPGLQITVDVNYGGLINSLVLESIQYLDQFQYYALETDHYESFTAYPDQIKGACWDGKSESYNCALVPDTANPTEGMLQTSDGQGFTKIPSDGNEVVDASGLGPGTQTTPTEPPTAGLPDFVTTGLKLTDSDEDEHYTFNTTDTLYMHSYSKNIGDADWAGDRDDIYVKSYLSSGYKEDAHSDWQCVGTQQIQKGNLDVGDTKHEWDSFSLSGLAPGVYNIVTCTDRKYDQDNGDGEVPEKHKSNNCTTGAVFIVKEANLRVSADFGKKIFKFGEQRTLSSFTINEGGDVHSDIKLRWYLSEGKTFNNPTLLGEDNMQEEHLQAGAEKLEDILFTAPTKRGNYTLSVHTDSASSFPEANEDDNWQHFVIRVDDFAWLPAVMDILNN